MDLWLRSADLVFKILRHEGHLNVASCVETELEANESESLTPEKLSDGVTWWRNSDTDGSVFERAISEQRRTLNIKLTGDSYISHM